jgi:disulfide bond formation protein DsbB|tara:strand:- start:23451 stop:24230 length:780 start_codon:yes stop_codon:yes gene_type:complete
MRALKFLLIAILVVGLAVGAWFGWQRHQEQALFRETIAANITAPTGTGLFVEQLNHWVYNKEGFEQCQARYVWSPLGATPLQIYQQGGDCSDKSRLLSAMLDSVGMDSTLVMLSPCRTCASTHTIVNAEVKGDVVAADPVYDIVWPDPAGGYRGVAEIRDDPAILAERLAELKRLRPLPDKIHFHSPDEMKYGFPKTVNWDRDAVFAGIGGIVGQFTDEPYLVQRPRIFEDPKLFLMWVGLVPAGVAAILLVLLRRRLR